MSGYYINVSVQSGDPAAVRREVEAVFFDEGFRRLSELPASEVIEDEDRLPEGDDWYGVIVSGAAGAGWVSVYVDDWQDSGLLAKRLAAGLSAPAIEVWVAEDVHWGYNFYNAAGVVTDRFADDPSQVAETPAEAAEYAGDPGVLESVAQVPRAGLEHVLAEARAQAGTFAAEPIERLAEALGLPFGHLFTGYDYFFTDDPDDYLPDLEQWPEFRHLAFQNPSGRDRLAE